MQRTVLPISFRSRPLLLALVVLCGSCSKDGDVARQGGTRAASDSNAISGGGHRANGGKDLGAISKDLGDLTDLIVAQAAELPRADFDPAALVKTVGTEPQALFEWVRDHTWWAPYRGLLRGAKGVMLDRVGNELDRTVLLGELLRRAGHTVRLAHAKLPETKARDLYVRIRPIPEQRRGVSPATGGLSPDRLRVADRIIPGFAHAIQASTVTSKQLRADGAALVRSQADAVTAAVRAGASPKPEAEQRAAITALQDHWWIEQQTKDGWEALDVLLPDAEMGHALLKATATSEWPKEAEFPAIPAADWQVVDVRVVIERYDAGATTESQVTEASLRPAEVFDKPITLAHIPQPWPDQLPDPQTNPQALRDAALNVREWIPFLRIGDTIAANLRFRNDGQTGANLDPLAGIAGAGPASTIDFTLGFGGGEAGPTVTAEWIDYEIHVPGQPSRNLRRPVFDLLGPARRASHAADFDGSPDLRKLERAEALLGRTDILLQPASFTGGFVSHLLLDAIVANQAALRELARERDPARAKNLANSLREHLPVWGPLPKLAASRWILSQAKETFPDRPNVLNYRSTVLLSGSGAIALRGLIDIADNGTGTRRSDAFEARVRQGVADTVAELLTLGNKVRGVENTASVFAMLADPGGRGLLIKAGDAEAVRGLPWPDDERTRLGTDVGAGFMAVVPREAVLIDDVQHVGWWRVDPISGETIGVMDSGFHSAEQSVLRASLNKYYIVLTSFYVANFAKFQTLQYEALWDEPDEEFYMLYIRVEAVMEQLAVELANLKGGIG